MWDGCGFMKKIYNDNAIGLFPLPNGFVVLVRQKEYDGKMVIQYKKISFEDGVVSSVTRNEFQYYKFGKNYKSFEMQLKGYLNWKIVTLPDYRIFAVHPDGTAKILDIDARTEWQGTMLYKEHGPADIALHGHTIWASFPESNALIRFNLRTMREELRIGGGNTSAFSKPSGLFVERDKMLVCNPGSNKLLEIDLNSYTVHEYAEFENPVYEYIKINASEIVMLSTGIYVL